MRNLALAYYEQGQYEKAEKIQVKLVETHRRIREADDPVTLSYMGNPAPTDMRLGQSEKAEQIQTEVVDATKRRLGIDHQ